VISALIVDDERIAREGIRLLLRSEPDVRVVGEAGDGASAIKAITSESPDLLFLDVRMPGLSGFDVLQRISQQRLPVVIFVTAFDKYAVKAFEAHALDYLLKPVDERRFREAIQRARDEVARQDLLDNARKRADFLKSHGNGLSANDELAPRAPYLERIAVRVRDRFVMVKVEEIDWIESAANYVQLYSRGRSFMMRMTMADIEQKLDAQRFARIHRSTIVNVDRLVEVKPSLHGDFDVVLSDGTTLRMSRAYRHTLLPR
jgi:two-component system LytT family response regulator